MDEKLLVFFDLARKLNRKFSVIPMLHGSLGLQMLVDVDLHPDDIDICVPQFLYRFSERWQDLLAFMQSEGYELIDLHEHLFQKGDICVNIGCIDGDEPRAIPSVEVFLGIDASEIPIKETDGAVYKLLSLKQYLQMYQTSLNDNYRADKSNHKDQGKVDILKRLIKCEG